VVRARLAQLLLHLIVQADPVADEDRDDDGGRAGTPAADVPCERRSGVGAKTGRSLFEPGAPPNHLHEEAIALWERGEELYKLCRTRLDAAQGRIEELAKQAEAQQASPSGAASE
jgi:hypothetical protein